MDRRTLLASLAAAPLVRGRQPSDRLIVDAMGELRTDYPSSLIGEMLASGMDAITVTLCDPKPEGAEAVALALDAIAEHDRFIAQHPTLLLKATTAADIDRARTSRRLAVFYLYQNTSQFGRSVDRVDLFHRLGLRSCQLTYNTRNEVGVGCWETGGLTEFGREMIDRLNHTRILIDLSHANMETMAGAIEASSAPVIVSHTACTAVHQHRRNTTDENLRRLAGRGGVVGICQMRPFLTTKKKDNLSAYFDHVLHAIRVAGIESVAIGSDRDHRVIELTPEYLAELKREEGAQVVDSDLPYFIDELNGPRRMEVVWDGLSKRGLTAREVELVMGVNVRRLYRAVIG
ncbi:MAG: hypothetical protein FJ206_14800 [Gemmatimonadetes bacterium]|nr:hypothetical protein [Gemmatimonadota bacterium]